MFIGTMWAAYDARSFGLYPSGDVCKDSFLSIHIYHILDYDALMISYLMYTVRIPHVS